MGGLWHKRRKDPREGWGGNYGTIRTLGGCGATSYKLFFAQLPPGATIAIGQTRTSRYFYGGSMRALFWSAACPPTSYVHSAGAVCTDDPKNSRATNEKLGLVCKDCLVGIGWLAWLLAWLLRVQLVHYGQPLGQSLGQPLGRPNKMQNLIRAIKFILVCK